MNIEELKSGKYRIRKTVNGKTYRVIIDHKPKQREAEVLMEEEIARQGGKPSTKYISNVTWDEAYQLYHDAHNNTFSSSTMRTMSSIRKNLSVGFRSTRMHEMDSMRVQREINLYAETRSPKSTDNAYNLIRVVIKFVAPDIVIKASLPPRMPKRKYLPTQSDVSRIFTELAGTEYEPMILLASLGLRRSEILALTPSDFHDGRVTINKAMVQGEDKKWVVQDRTKEPASCRDILIGQEMSDRILNNPAVIKSGRIYPRDPSNVSKVLYRTQKKLGIPRFGVHQLRHYYASQGHNLGIPDQALMANGGWKSKETLVRVYQEAMTEEQDTWQERYLEALKKAGD